MILSHLTVRLEDSIIYGFSNKETLSAHVISRVKWVDAETSPRAEDERGSSFPTWTKISSCKRGKWLHGKSPKTVVSCNTLCVRGAEWRWRLMFGDTVCLDEEQCCFIYYAQYLLYYGVYEKPHLYPKRVQSVVAYEDSVSFLRYHYSTKFSLHLLNCWSRTFKQKNQELSNTGTEPYTKVLALMVIPCSFCETLKDWVGGWASSVDLFKRWGLRHWE